MTIDELGASEAFLMIVGLPVDIRRLRIAALSIVRAPELDDDQRIAFTVIKSRALLPRHNTCWPLLRTCFPSIDDTILPSVVTVNPVDYAKMRLIFSA